MGRYSNLEENEAKIKQATKYFYKKYGIKVNGNDPIFEGIESFDDLLKSNIRNNDVKINNGECLESELYDNFATSFDSYYDYIFEKLLIYKRNDILSEENLVNYEQNKKDKTFISDFSSLMSEVFKENYYKKLSSEKRNQLKSEGRDEYYFKPTDESYLTIKGLVNGATDKKLERIKGGRYKDNQFVMNELNQALSASSNQNDSKKLSNESANMLAEYLFLKEQYNNRGTFTKWFLSFGTRRALAKAEKEIERLAKLGVIVKENGPDGKVDYAKTAVKYAPSSNYLGFIADSAKKENCQKNDFYEKNSIPSKDEIDKDKKLRHDTLVSDYVKAINRYIDGEEIEIGTVNLEKLTDEKEYYDAIELIKNGYKNTSNLEIKNKGKDYLDAVKKNTNKKSTTYLKFREDLNTTYKSFKKDHDFSKLKENFDKLDKFLSDNNINIKFNNYIDIDKIKNDEMTKLDKLEKKAPFANLNKQSQVVNLDNEFGKYEIDENEIENININELTEQINKKGNVEIDLDAPYKTN